MVPDIRKAFLLRNGHSSYRFLGIQSFLNAMHCHLPTFKGFFLVYSFVGLFIIGYYLKVRRITREESLSFLITVSLIFWTVPLAKLAEFSIINSRQTDSDCCLPKKMKTIHQLFFIRRLRPMVLKRTILTNQRIQTFTGLSLMRTVGKTG